MSYEPKEWQCGDVITAEDLNRMEQGIAQGGGSTPLIVGMEYREIESEDVLVLDKTWQEIHDAFPNVLIKRDEHSEEYGNFELMQTVLQVDAYTEQPEEPENLYSVFTASEHYETYSPNGYPTNGGK